jgi:hypothetical protein
LTHDTPTPVKAAGNLVGIRIELAARMKDRHHDLGRRTLFLFMNVSRDSAPVIDNGHRIVHVDRHLDRVAIARKRFVYRVIDDLVYQVMKSEIAGEPMYIAGRLRTAVASLKNRYLICPVFCFCLCQTSNLNY